MTSRSSPSTIVLLWKTWSDPSNLSVVWSLGFRLLLLFLIYSAAVEELTFLIQFTSKILKFGIGILLRRRRVFLVVLHMVISLGVLYKYIKKRDYVGCDIISNVFVVDCRNLNVV